MQNPYLKCFLNNCKKNNRGFSLIELMVVLVIVGILAIGVVFMFADPTAKVKAAAFEMRGDLNLARAEAVRRNDNILVDFVFTACSQADVDSGACAAVCGKVDKAGFDACYSGAGTNQGYVICSEDPSTVNNDCGDEVLPASAAADLEEKVIKTVLFKDSVRYYSFGATLPAAPSGPSTSPDGVALASNNGITFGEPPIPGSDFISMNANGTSSLTGSVVVYLAKDSTTVRGNPYAVVVDNTSTGRVHLERWRPEMAASGTWFRR